MSKSKTDVDVFQLLRLKRISHNFNSLIFHAILLQRHDITKELYHILMKSIFI